MHTSCYFLAISCLRGHNLQGNPYIKGDHFFDVIHSYDVIPARCHSCMGGWVRVHNQGSIFTELYLGGNIVGAVLYAGGGSIVGRKCL